jgi:hypothetical protein
MVNFFIHNTRRANVGFDHNTAAARNLPIVSAITSFVISDEK